MYIAAKHRFVNNALEKHQTVIYKYIGHVRIKCESDATPTQVHTQLYN